MSALLVCSGAELLAKALLLLVPSCWTTAAGTAACGAELVLGAALSAASVLAWSAALDCWRPLRVRVGSAAMIASVPRSGELLFSELARVRWPVCTLGGIVPGGLFRSLTGPEPRLANCDYLRTSRFVPEPIMATLLPQQGKAETLTPTAQLSQMCVYSGLLPCSESKAAGISQLHFW